MKRAARIFSTAVAVAVALVAVARSQPGGAVPTASAQQACNNTPVTTTRTPAPGVTEEMTVNFNSVEGLIRTVRTETAFVRIPPLGFFRNLLEPLIVLPQVSVGYGYPEWLTRAYGNNLDAIRAEIESGVLKNRCAV